MDSVLRRAHPERFKTIGLKHIEDDDRLSWKAVGLLTYMLTRPPEWAFYRGDLVKRHSDGRDGVKSGLRELREAGYLRTKPLPKGGWTWWVSDEPMSDGEWSSLIRKAGKPPTENPEGGESGHITDRTTQQEERLGCTPLSLDLDEGPDPRTAQFEQLWALDRRGKKKRARVEFMKAVPRRVSFDEIFKARTQVNDLAGGRQFVEYMSTWIRDDGWMIELADANGHTDQFDPLAEVERIQDTDYD